MVNMNLLKKIFFTVLILTMSLSLYAQNISVINDGILAKYQTDKRVKQLIVVSQTKNSNADIKMYIKDKNEKSGWKQIVSTTAFIGKNGLGKQTEGDLKTPKGEFNITKAFGIKENPGTKLKYINVTQNLYACDEDCKYYNRIIDARKTKHPCKGEHLIDYAPQYNYALCIDFNSKNIYPQGSNIFIHVKGKKSYTAGCIALDEESMITVLKNSTKKTKVYIF